MNILAHIIHTVGFILWVCILVGSFILGIYTLYDVARNDTMSFVWGASGAVIIIGLFWIYSWAEKRTRRNY